MADDNIRHVNCASDFRIVFAFSDGKLPDYPWRLGLKTPNTPSYNMYVASFDGTTYNNCSPLDDESIMVFVDHHRLVPGILHYYLQTDAPDSLFPDGEMNITIPGTVNIELWEGPSDGDTPPEVTVIVERLLKGDKGDPGDPGEAGQITFATASIDNTTGTPSVNIELGGTPEKRTIDFKFSGLKGEPGEPDESFVRYDEAQSLTTSEQAQAFANLGMKVYVTDSSFLGSTLSAEEIEEVFVSKAILLADTGDLFSFGAASSSQIYFYKFVNRSSIGYITLNKPRGSVSNGSFGYQDVNALHFVAQNPALTSAQQDVALSNIGLDFVHVDYSLLGTTLDDSTAALVENANGIILTNTPENYSQASVFLKSNYSNGLIYFNAWNGVSLVSQFYYNLSTKRVTTISNADLHFDSIRYSVSQNLTNTQKATARSNIGVQSADELLADDDFIASLKTKLGIG